MAESCDVIAVMSSQDPAEEEKGGGKGGGGLEGDAAAATEGEKGLTDAQREVLQRCLHALKHAKNDSHILAALLLVSFLIMLKTCRFYNVIKMVDLRDNI